MWQVFELQMQTLQHRRVMRFITATSSFFRRLHGL
jgi:hypothetical protein